MFNTKEKIIIVFLVFLIILFLSNNCFAKTEIEKLKIDATLIETGDMFIKETNYYNNNSEEVEQNGEEHTHFLKNIATKYRDIGEIVWNFKENNSNYDIKELEVNITLPDEAKNSEIYAFCHGLENYEIIKENNKVSIYAKNVKANQNADTRILFSRIAISDSINEIDKNFLNESMMQEEILLKEQRINKILSIKKLTIFWIIIAIITFIYIFFKYDKQYALKKQKYCSEIPYNLEPEILQTFYFKEPIRNSFYISFLNLIRLGIYRIETVLNEEGIEKKKIVYNENNDIELKEYQRDVVKLINGHLKRDEKGERGIELTELSSKMSYASVNTHKRYIKNLKLEKSAIVGKTDGAPAKVKILVISTFIAFLICTFIYTLLNKSETGYIIAPMMGFLTIIYSVMFITVGSFVPVLLFLIFHASCFQIGLIMIMVESKAVLLYIPYILLWLLIIYVFKFQKDSKREKEINESIKSLRRYIKDYSKINKKEFDVNTNLWEDYFILSIALKLNIKTIDYFYKYGKEESISNLGKALGKSNNYIEFYTDTYTPFYNLIKRSI